MAPLAFMRGRTLNNAFVILDEAQNTTPEQIVMFVTRMGFDSTFAINGDNSQSDLERPRNAPKEWCNGLEHAIRQLAGRDNSINYVKFFDSDSVRNPLVTRALGYFNTPNIASSDSMPNGCFLTKPLAMAS
jgi:phosphate starvation-inducible PhoH-like protein